MQGTDRTPYRRVCSPGQKINKVRARSQVVKYRMQFQKLKTSQEEKKLPAQTGISSTSNNP